MEIWLISFFQPLNFNCKPIENKAKGATVPDSLLKSGSAGERSIKDDKTNAVIHPINGGNVKSLFSKNLALMVLLFPPCRAVMMPSVERVRNMAWSQIIAMLKYSSP